MKQLPIRRRREQAGFTMVELLVTLVITTFGLLGILALHNSLAKGSTYSSQSQEAIAVGSQVMESLRALRPSQLSTEVTGTAQSPPYSEPAYTTVTGRNGISYAVGVAVTATTSVLWRVRVDVTWTDDVTGDTRTLPLELLRTSTEAL